jgi:glutaredoxin
VSNHSYPLRKTVQYCTEDSFKEAITKTILGFTFKKYGRKGKEYFQHNQHNALVARRFIEDLYAKLLELKDLSNYNVTVEFDMTWNSTGKIIGASNIRANIYQEVGTVTADQLTVYRTTDKVKLDVFFSDLDLGSKSLLNILTDVKKQFGEETFGIQEHKMLNDADYQKYAKSFGVTHVPTIFINDKKFENPTESVLRSNIEASVNSAVFLEGVELNKKIWKRS